MILFLITSFIPKLLLKSLILKFIVLILLPKNVISFDFREDPSWVSESDIQVCLSNLEKQFYLYDETTYYICNATFCPLSNFRNVIPSVVFKIEDVKNVLIVNRYAHYVLFSNHTENLENFLDELTSSHLWISSFNPNKFFFIITYNVHSFEDTFKIMWSYGIVNAYIVYYDSFNFDFHVYTAHRFEKGSQCGRNLFIYNLDECSLYTHQNFDTPDSYENCEFKVALLNRVLRAPYFQGTKSGGVMYAPLTILKEKLKLDLIVMEESKEEQLRLIKDEVLIGKNN